MQNRIKLFDYAPPSVLLLTRSSSFDYACRCRGLGAEWHKQYQVGPNPELHLRASDASVTADLSSDNNISAAITSRGISFGGDGLKVIEHQSGDVVNIELVEPSWTFGLGSYSVEIRVHVPRKLLLDIHTSDGDVSLRGMSGSLRVETGDGSIQGSDLAGDIETRSGDGDVHLTGAFNSVRVHTSDGSAEIHALPASRPDTEWRIESGDGDVRLFLPAKSCRRPPPAHRRR